MNKKVATDYLDKTPSADIEDIMFVFPEVTLKEAALAVQRQKPPKFLRSWPLRLPTAISLRGYKKIHNKVPEKYIGQAGY